MTKLPNHKHGMKVTNITSYISHRDMLKDMPGTIIEGKMFVKYEGDVIPEPVFRFMFPNPESLLIPVNYKGGNPCKKSENLK